MCIRDSANAENNNGMNAENLYIAEAYANKGPTMKRIRPRAQGRACLLYTSFHLPEYAIAQYWNAISAAAPNTDFVIYNIPQLAGAVSYTHLSRTGYVVS